MILKALNNLNNFYHSNIDQIRAIRYMTILPITITSMFYRAYSIHLLFLFFILRKRSEEKSIGYLMQSFYKEDMNYKLNWTFELLCKPVFKKLTFLKNIS